MRNGVQGHLRTHDGLERACTAIPARSQRAQEVAAYEYVRWADGGCIARLVNNALYATRFPMLQGISDPGACTDAGGGVRSPYDEANLTNEHVKDELGLQIRAATDVWHLVRVCWGHHVFGRQWCTRADVRSAIRLYIAERNRLNHLTP